MACEVLIISGTNRPGSNTLRIAHILLEHYRAIQQPARLFSLAEMPREIFDAGSYAAKPPAFLPIQRQVLDAGGLHIVTPEYNGSFPGVLKYFIDMLKFPESFERKPVAFVGLADGVWGGLRSVEQLQMIFGYRNAHIFPQRVFVPGVTKALSADGRLTDAGIDARLAQQASAFSQFIGCLLPR